jgi:hypothetical protein
MCLQNTYDCDDLEIELTFLSDAETVGSLLCTLCRPIRGPLKTFGGLEVAITVYIRSTAMKQNLKYNNFCAHGSRDKIFKKIRINAVDCVYVSR